MLHDYPLTRHGWTPPAETTNAVITNCSSEPNCVVLHVTSVYRTLPFPGTKKKSLILEQQTLLGSSCHQQTTETVTKG